MRPNRKNRLCGRHEKNCRKQRLECASQCNSSAVSDLIAAEIHLCYRRIGLVFVASEGAQHAKWVFLKKKHAHAYRKMEQRVVAMEPDTLDPEPVMSWDLLPARVTESEWKQRNPMTGATPRRTTGFHDKMCRTASRQSNPPPLLHHLTAACALVAQMRTKSTARTVSYFCVRHCLMFTVRAHVQRPLLCIREEKSARRWSSHRHFFEYLSPIPYTIQYMNIGCTVCHCGHITRRTSYYINQLSQFHCTRTHVLVKSVPTVLT